jgi:hypothetical protein
LGDIATNSFKSIWKSQKYRAFRQVILNNRQEIDICKNCSEGTQVWSWFLYNTHSPAVLIIGVVVVNPFFIRSTILWMNFRGG